MWGVRHGCVYVCVGEGCVGDVGCACGGAACVLRPGSWLGVRKEEQGACAAELVQVVQCTYRYNPSSPPHLADRCSHGALQLLPIAQLGTWCPAPVPIAAATSPYYLLPRGAQQRQEEVHKGPLEAGEAKHYPDGCSSRTVHTGWGCG